VVNVIAEQASLSEDTAAQLDGAGPPGPTTAQLRERTIAEALAQPQPTGWAKTNPAQVMGGGILPAPLLAAKLANTATIRPVSHPGDSPPEPRYVPSAGLARFVRCRDLTCRFPAARYRPTVAIWTTPFRIRWGQPRRPTQMPMSKTPSTPASQA
jgi:hypothetical protein